MFIRFARHAFTHRHLPRAAALCLCPLVLGLPAGAQAAQGVEIQDLGDKVRVEIDGKLFTEYQIKDVPRPYFYPVIGPEGDPIIRHWPMAEGKDEERDHVHHRSWWFTHGAVNGHDFWGESAECGKVVHDAFLELASGAQTGVIKSRNKYVAKDGTLVCTDTRTHTFHKRPDGAVLTDWAIVFHASQGQLVLGDTKEGSMAIRVAPTLRLEGKVAKGAIVNSEGLSGKEAWGKRAAWVDYYGPVNGKTVGVAIFDHPQNPRHPTWWMARNYGLFTANPFGKHVFEGGPAGSGDIAVPAGQSLTFRWRFYFHKGSAEQAKVAEHYKEYAKPKQ